MNQAKESTPAVEPVIDNLCRESTNIDEFSTASRQPTTTTEEPLIFMTTSEVEIMLRRENEKPDHI